MKVRNIVPSRERSDSTPLCDTFFIPRCVQLYRCIQYGTCIIYAPQEAELAGMTSPAHALADSNL